MNDIYKTVLEKIKDGKVDMKPRWHFVLKTVLSITAIVLVTLLTVYIFSFVFFFLQQSGVLFAAAFGFRGISFFVMSSPWLLIGAALLFVLLLSVFLTRFSFSYRRPLVYSFIGIVALALLGSFFIEHTTMHARLGSFAEREGVPVLAPLYRGAIEELPEGVHAGVITAINESGFILQTEEGRELQVVITPDTRLPHGLRFEVDDRVFVFTEDQGDTVDAFGVRPIKGPRRDRMMRFHSEEQFVPPMHESHTLPPDQMPEWGE